MPAALEQRHVDVLARNISNGRQLCLTQDQSIATVGGDPAVAKEMLLDKTIRELKRIPPEKLVDGRYERIRKLGNDAVTGE